VQYVLVFVALEISTQVHTRRSGVLVDPDEKRDPERST
jgi:hypothetical protein